MNQHKAQSWQARNIAYFLVSVALLFLLRSLWTFPIEHGDAVQKYFYSAEILRSGDWGILLQNHHTMRWAAMLPQTALTWLLGTRYEVFFILPLLMFSLCVVLIIFSMRKILNYSQQLLLAVILFVDPQGIEASVQLLNAPFAVFFAIAGVLLLIYQGQRRNLAVMFSAVLFFIAYGAHVTYLSLAVGGFVWLLLFQRKPSRAAVFSGTILLLLVTEILVFNYLSDWQLTMGRLELLANGKHVKRVMDSVDSGGVVNLLGRWLNLSLVDILLCLVFFVAGPWLIMQKKVGKHIPVFIECIYVVGLSFAFAITFAIVSIDPIKPAMSMRPMYLTPFLSFTAIIAVFLWSDLVSLLRAKRHSLLVSVANLVCAAVLVVFSTYYVAATIGFNGFIWKANSEYIDFSKRFQQGELLLTGQRKTVYRMIALFKHPVKTLNRESGISVVDPSPDALCVVRLKKIPLQSNYQDCVK
jgi:hypothetical protein